MKRRLFLLLGTLFSLSLVVSLLLWMPSGAHASTSYDINTLAGKVASVNGTVGLQTRISAFLQQEADAGEVGATGSPSPITPTFVLSSPLDGTTVQGPDVTVNQDTAAATQNETAIAVDPNNPNRVVGAANDYVTRTWTCTISGTPCSALGDAYSGTYFSNDGGKTWCCASALDGTSQGTLIPGVTHLSGGTYDAGGDPALAFDSRGNIYYAGFGFDRTSPPNTVAVNRGTFGGSGNLTWGPPTFINPTTSPATLNDKEWIAADAHSSSPFRDRVYVTWTRYIFNAHNGNFVQSPIDFAFSTNGGKTFSSPQLISGNVLYSQGSRPVVGPDGTLYVFWDGATTWSKPVEVSPLAEISTPADTVFRVNSFPAADVAPNGDLYAAWSTQVSDGSGGHSAAVYSKSTDGGATWSTPALIFPALDAQNRTPIGYPAPGLTTSDTHRFDTFWPGVAISPSGRVYLSAYAADVVSPWQTCANSPPPPEGRINCLALGNYINNARLDYAVVNLGTGTSKLVTTHPINTRYQFGGG